MLTTVASSGLTDLCTLAAAKLACGVSDASKDTLIASLITRASGDIAGYCGRAFGPARYTQTFRLYRRDETTARNREALNLSRWPLITDSTLVPPGMAVSIVVTEDGVTADPSTYEYDPSSAIVRRMEGDVRIPWGCTVATVTYTAGFGMPTTLGTYPVTLPQPVTNACLDLVAAALPAVGRDVALQSEQVMNLGRMIYFDRGNVAMDLTNDIKMKLRRFKTQGW